MSAMMSLWDSLWDWLMSPGEEEDVLGSYWPAGAASVPLELTEVDDESVDLESDIAWPTDVLSVN